MLAASLGDPAGIGAEILLRLWREGAPCPFFLAADPELLAERARGLKLDVPLAEISEAGEAAGLFSRALPVLPIKSNTTGAIKAGVPSKDSGAMAWASLEAAYEQAASGAAAGLVTAPVSKEHLALAGFRWAGQTEWLAEKSKSSSLMMLAAPGLRTALATGHLPLAEVSGALAKMGADGLVKKLSLLAESLKRDFAISQPRLALAAFNPHAGENGLLGDEEKQLLIPAAEQARKAGLAVTNPLPADSLFMPTMRQTYDAVLCLYHDQALIALKTLDFERGVNISLGLPIIRTSPDHGAAFDLAGRKGGEPPSIKPLFHAMQLASEMASHRAKT